MSSSTKSYILRIKKEIDTLRQTDEGLKRYIALMEEQTQQIKESFAELSCLDDVFPDEQERTEMFASINEHLETLNRENKQCKADMLEYVANMNEELGEFAKSKDLLFEKFILNDLDPEVLNHCLDTFGLYERGRIGMEQAKEMGFHKYHKTDN